MPPYPLEKISRTLFDERLVDAVRKYHRGKYWFFVFLGTFFQ